MCHNCNWSSFEPGSFTREKQRHKKRWTFFSFRWALSCLDFLWKFRSSSVSESNHSCFFSRYSFNCFLVSSINFLKKINYNLNKINKGTNCLSGICWPCNTVIYFISIKYRGLLKKNAHNTIVCKKMFPDMWGFLL